MTDIFEMLTSYFYDVFVTNFDGWVVLGFVAQGFFTMRFVVQWIASERARKSGRWRSKSSYLVRN